MKGAAAPWGLEVQAADAVDVEPCAPSAPYKRVYASVYGNGGTMWVSTFTGPDGTPWTRSVLAEILVQKGLL